MEPLNTPSIRMTLSPLRIRSCKVLITGKPAATFVSYKNLIFRWLDSFLSCWYLAKDPELAFLLGVTMAIFASKTCWYTSETSWLAVQSTNTEFEKFMLDMVSKNFCRSMG